jgi:hypothetical protein
MNDFTKEELEDIDTCVFNWNINHKSIDGFQKLRDKIQSMIDNYCEHEDKENIGGWCWKCTTCGMKFGDETQ